MKNAGLTIGMCVIGLGLASIGFNLDGNTATATPAAFNAGQVEPTIVWYDSHDVALNANEMRLIRAWSDGTVEARFFTFQYNQEGCVPGSTCNQDESWVVIASPNEGLNAQADINFDERVDAADLGQLIAAWGDAPRNDYPPSDCPLGLIP